VFSILNRGGKVSADANGSLWLTLDSNTTGVAVEPVRVGISPSNLFAVGSDPQFAYQLMLARLDRELAAPKHSRENLIEYRHDESLLAAVRAPLQAQMQPVAPQPPARSSMKSASKHASTLHTSFATQN
jgi:hypothetical protein